MRFPAIAEEDELHQIETILGPRTFMRRRGEALHPGLAWRVVLRTRGAKSREIKAVAVLRLEPSRGQQPTGPAGLTDVSLTGDR